jgi:transposase-like protein
MDIPKGMFDMNLLEVANLTEDQAREYLESLRWPNGPVCPHCESTNCTKMNGKKHRKGCIQCNNCECRQQFTVRVKGILESSKVSYKRWVLAFHLLCSSKKGFSALQLQRELGLGSYKTAWFMLHRIRHAMEAGAFGEKLDGVVEADEAYIGARRVRHPGTSKQGRGTVKQPIVALVQRDGQVRSGPVARVDGATIMAALKENVAPTATIVSDEASIYSKVGKEFARHEFVTHRDRQYVYRKADGFTVTTNLVECYFALIKRGHYGVYHLMSKGHLHRYLAEFGFRWNHRKVSDAQRREAAIRSAPGRRLRYKTPA